MGSDCLLLIVREGKPICIWPGINRAFERDYPFFGMIKEHSKRMGEPGEKPPARETLDSYPYLMSFQNLKQLIEQPRFEYQFEGFRFEEVQPTDKIYFIFDQ